MSRFLIIWTTENKQNIKSVATPILILNDQKICLPRKKLALTDLFLVVQYKENI